MISCMGMPPKCPKNVSGLQDQLALLLQEGHHLASSWWFPPPSSDTAMPIKALILSYSQRYHMTNRIIWHTSISAWWSCSRCTALHVFSNIGGAKKRWNFWVSDLQNVCCRWSRPGSHPQHFQQWHDTVFVCILKSPRIPLLIGHPFAAFKPSLTSEMEAKMNTPQTS